jgi:hypothetical protein
LASLDNTRNVSTKLLLQGTVLCSSGVECLAVGCCWSCFLLLLFANDSLTDRIRFNFEEKDVMMNVLLDVYVEKREGNKEKEEQEEQVDE